MAFQIRDVDRGYAKRMEALKRLRGSVSVGIHASEGAATQVDSELAVVDIGTIHEFGLGVPQRSFLRAFVDENQPKLRQLLTASAKMIASGQFTEQVALERFGLAVVGMVKQRMVAGIDPPLAESTKRQKRAKTGGGSKDTPLILFGQLISSILHQVELGSPKP